MGYSATSPSTALRIIRQYASASALARISGSEAPSPEPDTCTSVTVESERIRAARVSPISTRARARRRLGSERSITLNPTPTSTSSGLAARVQDFTGECLREAPRLPQPSYGSGPDVTTGKHPYRLPHFGHSARWLRNSPETTIRQRASRPWATPHEGGVSLAIPPAHSASPRPLTLIGETGERTERRTLQYEGLSVRNTFPCVFVRNSQKQHSISRMPLRQRLPASGLKQSYFAVTLHLQLPSWCPQP